MTYYPRLKDLREDNDLTQEEVAKILNTTYQYYNKYETGKIPITFERAIILAKYYKVSLDYIAGMTALVVLFLLIIANVIYSRAEKRNNKGIYKSTKKIMEKDGKKL